ncbi:MAG: hypothetical protein HPY53_15440 [Brevinematales bacterium]|nr:hypothetical protein [Brevinematales bacterium]
MKKKLSSFLSGFPLNGLDFLNLILPPYVNSSQWTSNPADIPSLINQVFILKTYGFTAGYYTPENPLTSKVDPRIEIEFGKIEAETNIDTAEEFITAGWFHPFTLNSVNMSGLERELPHTEYGALKLCAMWMKKRAENKGMVEIGEKLRDYSSGYSEVIEKIMHPYGLSHGTVDDYYRIAVRDSILKSGHRDLGYAFSSDILERSVLMPVIDYYMNPQRENFDRIVRANVYFLKQYIRNDNDRRISGFQSVLSGMDYRLSLASQKYAEREMISSSLPEWSPES